MIYKNSSCKCGSSFCEVCESLQKKVHHLVKPMGKFSKCQSNFETVLPSQNCVFGKVGLGFNPHSKKISTSKPFSSFFEKHLIELLKQPGFSCFYCMKKGHAVRFCRVRKFSIPRGFLKWVPKNFKVPNDLVNTHGPKITRALNLVS